MLVVLDEELEAFGTSFLVEANKEWSSDVLVFNDWDKKAGYVGCRKSIHPTR